MAFTLRLVLLALALPLALATDYTEVFYGEYKLDKDSPAYNFLPISRNQNQPKVCDASWAFAVTSAMSALFNFNNKGKALEVNLSPQMLINCAQQDFNCKNADAFNIEQTLDQLKTFGVAEESCNNYYADYTKDCSNMNKCKDCSNGEDIHKLSVCRALDYHSYKLKSWRKITSDEKDPKREADLFKQIHDSLDKNGPLVCKIQHDEGVFGFRTNKANRYDPKSKAVNEYTAWVSLVGYKVFEDVTKDVWILQTSYGANVGYHGLLYIAGGENINLFNILDNCYELTIDPAVEIVPNKEVSSPFTDLLGYKTVKKVHRDDIDPLNQGLIKFPGLMRRYNESLQVSADPDPIDWCNQYGRNFLTYVKNQHIPTYCGSCWIQAATSVLADRLNVANYRNGVVFPKHVLSVQAVINCREGGTCYGGDSSLFFQKAMGWTVPIETCRTYESHNPESYECSSTQVCTNSSRNKTYELKTFNGVKVSHWERARGAQAMKAALADGPIVCDMQVTDNFVKYKRNDDGSLNVYNEELEYFSLNHAISIVGWGKNNDGEYWVGRNSWGREWGYDGLFYIKAGSNVLGIESDCSWAVPQYVPFE